MSNPNKDAVDLVNLIKDKFTMRKDIAPVETSSTASRAYKVGEKFYYGNLLQKATQDIAQGTGLAGGVNFENAEPVTEQVTSLKETLTNQTNGLIGNAQKCGCVNHLIFDLAHIKSINIAGSWSGNVYTHNGVQFTVNDNGTVTAHRASPNSNSAVLYYASKATGINGLEAVPYKLCGCPSGGSNAYRMTAKSLDSNYYDDTGNGINIPSKLLNYISCVVTGDYTGSDITFKPMIADADMPDANYANWAPYSKSNKELTEDTTVVNEYSRVTNVNSKITPALNTNLLIVVRYGRLVTFHVYIGDATDLTAWSEELLKLPADLAPLSDLCINSGGGTGRSVVLRSTGSLNVVTGSETLHGNSFDATYICRG